MKNVYSFLIVVYLLITCQEQKQKYNSDQKLSLAPTEFATVSIKNAGFKVLKLELYSKTGNAYLTVKAASNILIDFLPVPDSGSQKSNQIVRFNKPGDYIFTAIREGGDLTIRSLELRDYRGPAIPQFTDKSEELGFETPYTWKYGGPSIGDIDNDGYYDMVLNNHDKVPATLFWNKAGVKLEEHPKPLRPWDVHGSALGDYDNDGDLDIIIAQGGGNGTNPQPAHLLRNDGDKFVHVSDSAGISVGARGRSARWIDMDLDNDLDLLLINATGILNNDESKNKVFRNNGDGTFTLISSPGIDMAPGERLHVTDINSDGIDDLVLFFPLSIWQGNGDLTFTDVSESWLPKELIDLNLVTGAAVVDIDNDTDMDLYLARGKPYYEMALKNIDFDSLHARVNLREEGNKGRRAIEFIAPDSIELRDFFYWYRLYDDGFPLYLGSMKTRVDRADTTLIIVSPEMALGFPEDIDANGWYLGYLGEDHWRLEWNKTANIYWGIRVSICGITHIMPDFEPQNRNVQDILLRNEGDRFVDITSRSKLPKGGNAQGVIAADFNNDGLNDFYVFRFGKLNSRVTDWMLINQGEEFLSTQNHGARDWQDPGHGDMGAAFDLDIDGKIDLLSGSDNPGKWYIYSYKENLGNYLTVNVGYSPKEHVDPLSAKVLVHAGGLIQQKIIGSQGAVHSQSLLNNPHFGLGDISQVDSVRVIWRNGETVVLGRKKANQSLYVGFILPKPTQ